jgi:hypothetical protein
LEPTRYNLDLSKRRAAAVKTTTLAASTRAKDELRLEYKLASANGTAQLVSKTEKTKAEADGVDLLTPLVDRAAETIAAAVARK